MDRETVMYLPNFNEELFRQNLGGFQLSPKSENTLVGYVRVLILNAEQVIPDAFYDVPKTIKTIADAKGEPVKSVLAAILHDPLPLFETHEIPTTRTNRPAYNHDRAVAAVQPAIRMQARRTKRDIDAKITPLTTQMLSVATRDRIPPEQRNRVHVIEDVGGKTVVLSSKGGHTPKP